jgi:hypothetical protein
VLADDLLTPLQCQAKGASKVYWNLLAFVTTNYAQKPKETQAIIFAVSYLMYRKKKKEHINAIVQQANKPDLTQIADVESRLETFEDLAKHTFLADAEQAFHLFDKMHSDVLAQTFSTVEASIKRAVNPPQKWYESVFGFLVVDSLKHFIILFMAVFVWALGVLWIIDKIMPTLRAEIVYFVQEEGRWFAHTDEDNKSHSDDTKPH